MLSTSFVGSDFELEPDQIVMSVQCSQSWPKDHWFWRRARSDALLELLETITYLYENIRRRRLVSSRPLTPWYRKNSSCNSRNMTFISLDPSATSFRTYRNGKRVDCSLIFPVSFLVRPYIDIHGDLILIWIQVLCEHRPPVSTCRFQNLILVSGTWRGWWLSRTPLGPTRIYYIVGTIHRELIYWVCSF